jgi:hypothetical protein
MVRLYEQTFVLKSPPIANLQIANSMSLRNNEVNPKSCLALYFDPPIRIFV